jgi:hypothetical protein
VGGPDRAHNPLFLTTIPEMGDEGRVPPPLDGVGDKLNDEWLRHVLNEGAKDRPYMLTRMPRFAVETVARLADAFIAHDRKPASPAVPLPEAEIRAKAVGRHLVGDQALGCIKCHTFGPHQTPGIRAIELQTMTRRVREDWFYRYMVDPPAYRPGTRMPTGFPEGRATIRNVYDGAPAKQLAAIWTYLKDGDRAGLPDGLIGNVIELTPVDRPLIYRNFIEGVSPRAIAVGYPEKVHLAWDANKVCLTLLWHGRFIDAGKHWEGRGAGFQGPLGDHVIRLEDTAPFAVLESQQSPWPALSPRELGWRFKRYQLDAAGRPHFHYQSPEVSIEDFPRPLAGDSDSSIERRLIVKTSRQIDNLWFRAAAGKIETETNGDYLVNDVYRIRLPGARAIVRESNGKRELLVPVSVNNNTAEVVQQILW